MIRPTTALWLAVCVGVIGGVYYLKNEVHGLERSRDRVLAEIRAEREAIQILRAEWAYLNRTDRLRTLADTLLPDLRPIGRGQIRRFDAPPSELDRQNAAMPGSGGGRGAR